VIKITQLKDFNPGRFQEEMEAAALLLRTHFAGFDEVNRRLVAPTSVPKLITRRETRTELFEDFAQPGEVRFSTDESNRTALETLLDAHVATAQSQEQDDEDIDDAVREELRTIQAGGVTGANRNRALEIVVRLIARDVL